MDQLQNSLEELSLRKQLLQHIQADKPILKHDYSLHGHAEPHSLVYEQESRLDLNGSQNAQTTYNYLLVNNQATGPPSYSLQHQKNAITGETMISQNKSVKGIRNPYNRPLSAKEANDDMQKQRKRYIVSPSGIPVISASLSNLQNTPSDRGVALDYYSGSSLQYNTFMRPQSGLRKDLPPDATLPQQKVLYSSLKAGDSNVQFQKSTVSNQFTGKVIKKQINSDQSQSLFRKKLLVLPGSPSHVTQAAKAATGSCDVQQKSVTNIFGTWNPNYPQGTNTRPYVEVNDTIHKDALSAGGNVHKTFGIGSNQTYSPFSRSINLEKSSAVSKDINTPKPYPSLRASLHAGGKGHGHQGGYGKKEPLTVPFEGFVNQVDEDFKDSNLLVHSFKGNSLCSTKIETGGKGHVTHTTLGKLNYKKPLEETNKEKKTKELPIGAEERSGGDGAPSINSDINGEKKYPVQDNLEEKDEDSTPSEERLPGDGETSCDDWNEDDDGIDDLYEDDNEDDSDDDVTTTSSLSNKTSSTVCLKSATKHFSTTLSTRSDTTDGEPAYCCIETQTSLEETVLKPALCPSLFPAIPPTINFVGEGEKVEQLPWAIRKLLKWRMSPITPNVVKSAIARAHFRITKKNHDWIGCFGKHMKSTGFKSIREYQKINHFPGSFQLGRKDRLWKNLSRMQLNFGKREFSFFPQTFVLPSDLKLLKRAFEDGNSRQKWIVKPPASARGIGIKVINKWSQLPRRRAVIVQKYLAKPLLINDSKFDMRVYVYVTSYDPLRAYVFEDGLARFASCKYSQSLKSLGNKFMHLTNYSVNKHNAEYQSNADDTVCQGHKWSLKSLWSYLKKHGVNTAAIWESIKDIVVKTLISAEASINSMIKCNVRSRYVVHELFGFDILLDENYKPWVLEVNISPSLHSNSQLDISVKGQMICDMLNLAGLRIPDKNDVLHGNHQNAATVDLSAHIPPNDFCIDKRLLTNQLASDERAKHVYFCTRHQDEALQTILDILTPDDVRILTESIDEDSRKGGFVRVFPTPLTKKYLRYFEQPRYYNLLLDQWVQRHNHIEQRGISLLQSLCEDRIHLESPFDGHRNQWIMPNYATMLTIHDFRQPGAPLPKTKDSSGGKTKDTQSVSRLPQVRNGVTGPSLCFPQAPSGFSNTNSSPSSNSLGHISQNNSQVFTKPYPHISR